MSVALLLAGWPVCCSFAQSCTTLCHPMNRSMPGFPVLFHLPKSAQTHIHWVGDVIQSSHPLSPPSPALHLFQLQGLFQWDGSSYQMVKRALRTPWTVWKDQWVTDSNQGMSWIKQLSGLRKRMLMISKVHVCAWPYSRRVQGDLQKYRLHKIISRWNKNRKQWSQGGNTHGLRMGVRAGWTGSDVTGVRRKEQLFLISKWGAKAPCPTEADRFTSKVWGLWRK